MVLNLNIFCSNRYNRNILELNFISSKVDMRKITKFAITWWFNRIRRSSTSTVVAKSIWYSIKLYFDLRGFERFFFWFCFYLFFSAYVIEGLSIESIIRKLNNQIKKALK